MAFQSEQSIQGTPSVCHAGTAAVTASVTLEIQSQETCIDASAVNQVVGQRAHPVYSCASMKNPQY